MAFGMHFDNCGSICDPVPGLLVSLGVYVEFLQEGLNINLVLYFQKTSLEVLSEGHLLVSVSLTWCLIYYSAG